MKKYLLVLFLLCFSVYVAKAQDRKITGKVTSAEEGEPIPGVSVLVKGTTTGTITDLDGNYEISVPDNATTLVFSYVGYSGQEREIGNESVINVALSSDIEDLSEVVVTAFGLEREKKSLTYTVQDVSARELSEARELNIVNSLSGKVAGLSITRSGSGVGSPSRVIMRGDRSINGNSQPLYIVDGVPASGISDISPDDIASINVLKGPNAAALYGSRANNGAIILTTKSGTTEGFTASLNTSFMADSPILLSNYQNVYGQGSAGTYSPSSEFSWGPRMEGQMVDHWSPDPNWPVEQYEFLPQPNNIRDFFQTGHNLATTLSIRAGNEKTQTYFSYSFTDAAGVVPTNELTRHNVNLRVTNKLSDRITLDSKITYIQEDIDNQLNQGENFFQPYTTCL
jgi:TonB-linked SusC/RagA family outer membrane protein